VMLKAQEIKWRETRGCWSSLLRKPPC